MSAHSVLQDLFDHNDWANKRIFALCKKLSDEQLDAPREMGFGSLRNTIFHNLEAEKIWLERWQGKPWRPLEPDANGLPINEIAEQSIAVANERNQMIASEGEAGFGRIVEFQDSKKNDYRLPVGDLMNHVSNHGIHHRAQALSYLKSFGETIPGGLDYIFYKLAHPSCDQLPGSREQLEQYGLLFDVERGSSVDFEPNRIKTYFAYSDWAMNRVHEEASRVDDAELDRELGLGMGTLRKNLQHMIDAERWWVSNWEQRGAAFPSGEEPRFLEEMRDLYAEVSGQRNAFVETLDSDAANRVVEVQGGGPVTCFRVTESLLQLCGHATHHRSQCVNMLRQLGITFSWIDMIVWLRENG